MDRLTIINTRKDGDRPYIAGLHKHQVGLYAGSLYAAKQLALEFFKPKKRDAGLVSVDLATEG